MHFGYYTEATGEQVPPELCIIPDRLSLFSRPVKVSTMVSTDSAVHFVSLEESILYSEENGGRTKIIKPVRPAMLYLTPNLPADPGFSVDAVKIIEKDAQQFEIYYQRGGRNWENWEPEKRLG
ncbi:hypothetical protein BVY02_01090 [bacterium J17]|nr:hypothetical protein BVY02_01090 [bacterium J17]